MLSSESSVVESTHSRKKAKSAASFFAPPLRNEHIEYWEHTKYYLKELRTCFTPKNRLKRVKIFVSIKKRFLVDVLIMIVAMVVMMTDQDIKNKDKVGDCNAVDHGDVDHGDVDYGGVDHGDVDDGDVDDGDVDHGDVDHSDGGHVETSENLIFFW